MKFTRLLLVAVLAAGLPDLCATPPPTPTHADVSYGPHSHHLMDIHVPTNGSGPFPVLIWYGGIWKPSKHVPDLNRFLPQQIAVIGVETRTLTDGVQEKANPPVADVMNDACRAVQFVRLAVNISNGDRRHRTRRGAAPLQRKQRLRG